MEGMTRGQLRRACAQGCFSGGCEDCWTTGCDHHAAIPEPPISKTAILDALRYASAAAPGSLDDEPFDKMADSILHRLYARSSSKVETGVEK